MDSKKTGILYLVATPVGNLEDISLRALRILKEADLIACEDTRTSSHLLKTYEIAAPVTSYHKFNEEAKSEELIGKMQNGAAVALITDAGMPAISDPGEILVRKCHLAGVPVTAVPGPCAAVTALALSGLDTRRFVFEGFLPSDNKEKKEVLRAISEETRTMILYEAPHRLVKTLEALASVLGEDRELVLVREMTKKFEEIIPATLGEAMRTEAAPRGEYVLVIAGKSREILKEEKAARWEQLGIPEHVAMYEQRGMDRKAAMKAAAEDRGLSKRDIYQALIRDDPER